MQRDSHLVPSNLKLLAEKDIDMERIREMISAPKICLDELPAFLRVPAAPERGSMKSHEGRHV